MYCDVLVGVVVMVDGGVLVGVVLMVGSCFSGCWCAVGCSQCWWLLLYWCQERKSEMFDQSYLFLSSSNE